MNAATWLVIAIVGFSLAGVALVVAIFMFIKMDIPAIIGDLTGKTVAREIKAMRDANASSGDKRFRPSKVNLERGTLTEKVDQTLLDANALKKAHASKRLDKTTSELSVKATEKLSDNATEVLSTDATEVLSDNATEVLSTSATEVLSESTTVLSGSTMVLTQTEELENEAVTPVSFKVLKSEIVIHSDEVI